ncbi:hypothetical protein [Desulfomicrobium apsheronum]|nr:hypothetical protein [Desulfomicrobium apsheronum]
METELYGRWIPAFAGMTRWIVREPRSLVPESACPPCVDVIPAKAGIHAFHAFQRLWNENADGNNPYGRWIPAFAGMTRGIVREPRSLVPESACPPCVDVIPAKAGIHAFHAFQRLWNENAADGNNP